MSAPESYPPLSDYALIGDCRSAALIGRDGGLDWLCWPRFDSPSVFAALLDRERGGSLSVRPVGPFEVERRYVPGTNVLETTFHTEGGSVCVTDCMPVRGDTRRRPVWPQREILRRIEGRTGIVDVRVCCAPRFQYATVEREPRARGAFGYSWDDGEQYLLRSDVRLHRIGQDVVGRAQLRAGDVRWVSLSLARDEPAVIPPLGEEAEERLTVTTAWWRAWSDAITYDGPYRQAVIRSALVLKLMTYAASGAVVAAPTTSLPEELGGERNWDYRYCWLRDASLTLRALFDLGLRAEGEAFLSWLLHAAHLTRPELNVLYDVYGRTKLSEATLDHLEGYAGSRPVRIGNAADDQFQLDVYGEVLDAAYQYVQRGGELTRSQSDLLVSLGKTVTKRWQEPDEGIWEIRSERRHHTYSKAMAWVALDRGVRLHEQDALHTRLSPSGWGETRDAIRAELEQEGVDPERGCYTTAYGEQALDASLLLLGLYRYAPLRAPRMWQTYLCVLEDLEAEGLLYRYPPGTDDGLDGEEGAFGICSFWAVAFEALAGEQARARERFERLLGYANDLGLYSEEIDPKTGELLGNFPQAFTHVGLINAAIAMANAEAATPEAQPHVFTADRTTS